MNKTETTPTHVRVKLLKTSQRKRILKTAEEKKIHYPQKSNKKTNKTCIISNKGRKRKQKTMK